MKPRPDPTRTTKPSKNRCPECLYHVRGPNHDRGEHHENRHPDLRAAKWKKILG